MTGKDIDYKKMRGELDFILDKIQSEDVEIDEAIKLYSKGIKLAKELEEYLDSAQNEIIKLNKK